MLNFYQQLAKTLKKDAVVLATVTSTKGSTPREVGAKMFITADGKTFGTIGGGAGEAKVYQQALQVLQTGKKQFVEIDLSGAPQRETQGVCGGTMQVLLELWSGSESLNLVNQIINTLTSGRLATIIMPFNTGEKPYLLLQTEVIASLHSTALIEPLLPPPTLLIIGAGHIAISLAQITKIAGFQVIVQDDRSDFATKERFPEASLVLAEPITSIQEILNINTNLYVALVTRGYLEDLAVLRLLCKYKVQYIGMVGSSKRVSTVYKILQNEGCTPEFLHQIYAPIGLDIGALTPEEIAVSICAELIKVRRGGTGTSLSGKI
ncbi:xdhC, xanthine dehydrogenase accessory factor [Nostoc flagelliforme CCNUN1]|uniref:XdhC, xanthine dehydrogenase accessory factor n=1 Tax=Nostoc flagelliforme CCNUN1 TaxID=2038116 RepID=A0A2K8T177_9NOSO|nr:XdhC/CoxI family protein [Nostoc flagelliforme]AUB41454.1 xdhC, xanthine dehydrogenase accessory factor [Nostoc flagelliforme CCNUN1]